MKRKLVGVLKYILFFGIGIFLVWWQFSKMTLIQKEQFIESLKHANYWIIIPVVFISLLSHISRAMRWKILMEPMGYNPPTTTTFYCVMIGYFVNTFLPRAGEVAKCSLLSRYERIPTNKLIGTILVERIFDLLCYIILIIFTVLIQLNFVTSFVKEKLWAIKGNGALMKIVLIITIIIVLIILVRWLIKKYSHHHYVHKAKGFSIGLLEGFQSIKYLRRKGAFLGHTFFIWSMYLLQIYMGFFALSATHGLNLVNACSVLSLATLAMIVSPGGIGAFPVAVQEVLLLYHIDNVSFGWLIWGVTTSIVIIGGIVSFLLLLNKNKRDYEPVATSAEQGIH